MAGWRCGRRTDDLERWQQVRAGARIDWWRRGACGAGTLIGGLPRAVMLGAVPRGGLGFHRGAS